MAESSLSDDRRQQLKDQIRSAFPPQPRNALRRKKFDTHEKADFLFDKHGFLRDWADVEPIQYRYGAAILTNILFDPSLAPLILGGFLNAIVTLPPEDSDILPEYFVGFLGGKTHHNETRRFLNSLTEDQFAAVAETFAFVVKDWRAWGVPMSRDERQAQERLSQWVAR